MRSLEFTAIGDPKAQPRPRAFVRGRHAGVYDPGTAERWKALVREAAKQEWDGKPFEGPLRVRLDFVFRRPKSHYRSGKHSNERRQDCPTWHTQKPDADNAAKAVMDALTDVGIWFDDAQICSLSAVKLWGDLMTYSPGVRVKITQMEEETLE